MTASHPGSALLGPLLSDAETADLFTDEAAVRAMLDFEVALAVVSERLDVIPQGSADLISAAARALQPDWAELGARVGCRRASGGSLGPPTAPGIRYSRRLRSLRGNCPGCSGHRARDPAQQGAR